MQINPNFGSNNEFDDPPRDGFFTFLMVLGAVCAVAALVMWVAWWR